MPEMNPELKAQLEEQKKNCPFCKIISGEIPAEKTYEDKAIAGILDINPCTKGHMLLMPKEHYPIMPLLPAETFRHLFGKLPKICGALKKAVLCTGCNVFIANGGVAGQQSPHFLIHLIPREEKDKIYNFLLDKKKDLEDDKVDQVKAMISKNFPIMMQNHFSRNPAEWHKGDIRRAKFLEKEEVLYEDEKAACVMPKNPQCIGHLMIYSQEEESLFENLSKESAAHMFYAASFASTAVFEGLKAQGSNIILKSGTSDDNPDGRLCIHILPRFQEDGLDVMCRPMPKKPDIASIAKKIKDKMFVVEHEDQDKKEKKVINLDEQEKILKMSKGKHDEEKRQSPLDEIKSAIEKIRN